MKIIFEYTFEDGCYGHVDYKGERRVDVDLKEFLEVELPPCDNCVKVTTRDFKTAEVEFPYGAKLRVGLDKTPFKYSESYECFGDARYYDLSGTFRLTEDEE